MASLSNTELSKFRNGEYRWRIFTRKLVANQPFEFTPKTQQRLGVERAMLQPLDPDFFWEEVEKGIKTGKFESLSGVRFRVIHYAIEEGVTIGLTNLQKTKQFGSSDGNGGGVEQTAYIEYKTAIKCAELTGGKINDIPQSEVLATHTIQDTYWEPKLDESWKSSLEETPKVIVSSSLTLPDYHYSDDLTKWVSDSYKKCRVGTSYAIRNFNKWNPADIWCSSGSLVPISQSLFECNTLSELGKVCYSSQLKGISLKKDGTEIKEVRWQENIPWEVENWEYRGDFKNTTTKGITIKFNLKDGKDKYLFIRPDRQTYRAEVKTIGSDHRNGCCGLYQINASLAAQGLKFRFQPQVGIQELRKSVDLERAVYLNARYELSKFMEYFCHITKEKQKLFIADLVRHCVCQSRDHCTYLKIS